MPKNEMLRFVRLSMENNQENDVRRAVAVASKKKRDEAKRESEVEKESEFVKFLETFLQVLSDPEANITVEIFPGESTTRVAIIGLNKYPAVVQELVDEFVSTIGQIDRTLSVSQNFFLQMMAYFRKSSGDESEASPSAEIVDGVYTVNLRQNVRVSEKHPSELAFYLRVEQRKNS
ncbi:MAG: hypothetical protein GW947_00525 [Candidatus Pacebacteria bacterium]|nr:hypothetical protein [Candidatus Paceibacterota bacterium]